MLLMGINVIIANHAANEQNCKKNYLRSLFLDLSTRKQDKNLIIIIYFYCDKFEYF